MYIFTSFGMPVLDRASGYPVVEGSRSTTSVVREAFDLEDAFVFTIPCLIHFRLYIS
jgi:hypothetical protein